MYCFLHPEDYSSDVEDTNKKEKKKKKGKPTKKKRRRRREEDEHSDDEITEISPGKEVSSNLALKLLVSL